jgi:hypothetical protein
LLGTRNGRRSRIRTFILYDDLDPHALDSGIVHFDGRYFGTLWEICKSLGLVVVADIHTHPGGPQQSESDRAHPMIVSPGHIALILPRFAAGRQRRGATGIYRYEGRANWFSVPVDQRQTFFHIGI